MRNSVFQINIRNYFCLGSKGFFGKRRNVYYLRELGEQSKLALILGCDIKNCFFFEKYKNFFTGFFFFYFMLGWVSDPVSPLLPTLKEESLWFWDIWDKQVWELVGFFIRKVNLPHQLEIRISKVLLKKLSYIKIWSDSLVFLVWIKVSYCYKMSWKFLLSLISIKSSHVFFFKYWRFFGTFV